MRSKDVIIIKDWIKRKSFLKTEFKKIIYRSILQNINFNKLVRIEMMKKLIFLKKKNSICRQNNVCLLTGRIGGVFKKYNLSRQSIKRIAKITCLNNTKAISF